MKKPTFKIGDWVKIKAVAFLEYDHNNNRQVLSTPIEKIGQICGAKRRMLGKYIGYKPQRSYFGSYDGYDQPYLEVKGSIVLWLVRTGYLNKPLEVLEEDIETHEHWNPKDITPLPWFHKVDVWTESDKETLRRAVKDAPRDKKGRWI